MTISCPVCKHYATEQPGKVRGDEVWLDCHECGGSIPFGGRYREVCKSREARPHLSAILRRVLASGEITKPIGSDEEIESMGG